MYLHKSFNIIFFFGLLFCCGWSSSTSANPPDESAFIQEFLGQMDFVEGRLTQLAEAIPQDKYD